MIRLRNYIEYSKNGFNVFISILKKIKNFLIGECNENFEGFLICIGCLTVLGCVILSNSKQEDIKKAEKLEYRKEVIQDLCSRKQYDFCEVAEIKYKEKDYELGTKG